MHVENTSVDWWGFFFSYILETSSCLFDFSFLCFFKAVHSFLYQCKWQDFESRSKASLRTRGPFPGLKERTAQDNQTGMKTAISSKCSDLSLWIYLCGVITTKLEVNGALCEQSHPEISHQMKHYVIFRQCLRESSCGSVGLRLNYIVGSDEGTSCREIDPRLAHFSQNMLTSICKERKRKQVFV